MAKSAKKYPCKVDTCITQQGLMSFRVKLMRGGHLVDKSFDTLADARIFRDLTLANAALDTNEQATFVARAKKVENKSFTFVQAIEKYRKDKSEKKKGWEKEKSQLDKLARSEIATMPLYQIKSTDIIKLMKWIKISGRYIKAKDTKTKTDVRVLKKMVATDATVRRYFNLIRHIFEIAATEWNKIDSNPCANVPKSARPKDGAPRDRRLRGNEYALMLEQLTGQAKVVFVLSVETAMRRGEILSMKWENLDLNNSYLMLKAADTKTDDARYIPLSNAALDVIKGLPRGIKGDILNITIGQLRHAWKLARVAIRAPDLRMHDMRHEATSRLFEKGFGDIEAASVTGHKTLGMLKRYSHLKHEHLLDKINRPARA